MKKYDGVMYLFDFNNDSNYKLWHFQNLQIKHSKIYEYLYNLLTSFMTSSGHFVMALS